FNRAQQARSYRLEASALSNLGDIYEQEHNYSRARQFYSRSLTLCRSLHHVLGEAEAQIHLGHLYAETAQWAAAVESLNKALELSEKAGRLGSRAHSYYELAHLYQNWHQLDVAKAKAESAIEIIESQRTKVSDFGSRATYFASVHEYYQLYIE